MNRIIVTIMTIIGIVDGFIETVPVIIGTIIIIIDTIIIIIETVIIIISTMIPHLVHDEGNKPLFLE